MGSYKLCSVPKSVILILLLFFHVGLISCEGKKIEISKTNSPPLINSITILPEKPKKESELNLSIQSKDPEGDPITYTYQWMRNDEEMIGEDRNTLKSGNFKKGDLIRVKVTPSDGKTEGESPCQP